MIITPKLVVKLFSKLKSQDILYDLDFPHDDRTRSDGYCIAYSLKSTIQSANRLYFRRTDNRGWNLRDYNTDNHMIFDLREKQDQFRDCYWAVRITPGVVTELLEQQREYLKLKT